MIQEMGVEQFLSWTKDLDINILFPNYDEGRVLTGFDDPDDILKSLAKIYNDALIILKLDCVCPFNRYFISPIIKIIIFKKILTLVP